MNRHDIIFNGLMLALTCAVGIPAAKHQAAQNQAVYISQAKADIQDTLVNVFTVSGGCDALKEGPLAGQDGLDATVEGNFIKGVRRLSRHEFQVVFRDEFSVIHDNLGTSFDRVDIRDMRHDRSCKGPSPWQSQA